MIKNAIGHEGAHVILQSAVNNEACQADIHFDDVYMIDSEVRKLINIMEDRRRMKQMWLVILCDV